MTYIIKMMTYIIKMMTYIVKMMTYIIKMMTYIIKIVSRKLRLKPIIYIDPNDFAFIEVLFKSQYLFLFQ